MNTEKENILKNDNENNGSKQSFETNLAELEKVVASLEKGDVSLDEMLTLFEKGVKLTQSCTNALDSAEQKITVLMRDKESGLIVERPFAAQAEQN